MKLILCLLGILSSALSYSGTSNISSLPTTCQAGNLTIPCDSAFWDLGVQALYLQPSFGPDISFLPTTQVQFFDPSANWGYRLQGSYYFNTGNDINLNWTHYDANTDPGRFMGQFPVIEGFAAAPFQLFLNTKYDQVNLVMGQFVNAGLSSARFYAGFQYAAFKIDETNFYTVPTPFIPLTGATVIDSNYMDFNGAGPVLGLNLMREIIPGLSINANTQGSIVYGTSRLSMATAFGNGLVVRAFYGAHKILVPSVEAKIGANYAYPVFSGILNLEGGYQAVNYFSSLNTAPLLGFMGKGDFGMFGPYFGLRWLATA